MASTSSHSLVAAVLLLSAVVAFAGVIEDTCQAYPYPDPVRGLPSPCTECLNGNPKSSAGDARTLAAVLLSCLAKGMAAEGTLAPRCAQNFADAQGLFSKAAGDFTQAKAAVAKCGFYLNTCANSIMDGTPVSDAYYVQSEKIRTLCDAASDQINKAA